MNPNETIRKWLLACGKQFGIRQAHDYRWPDADTRQQEPYCTYQSLGGVQSQDGIEDASSRDHFDVIHGGRREHVQKFQIDLYRSQNGLYELEAMCIAADGVQAIRNLFDDGGCAFAGCESIANMTTFDQAQIDYHFRAVVYFREFVEIELKSINDYVDSIDMTYTVDDTVTIAATKQEGFLLTAGALEVSGSADLVEN